MKRRHLLSGWPIPLSRGAMHPPKPDQTFINEIAMPKLISDPEIYRPISLAERLWERLSVSHTFTNYQLAFEKATGLPLWLESPESRRNAHHSCSSQSSSAFCATLNNDSAHCEACQAAHQRLREQAGQEACTVQCFAGFLETALPVRLGTLVVGFLRSGQVLPSDAQVQDYEKVIAVARKSADLTEAEWQQLAQDYQSSRRVDRDTYDGMIQLLAFFARQLSSELERLKDQPVEDFPESVQRTCRFLRQNFDRDIPLEETARIAGVSAHHLCLVFKSATGMTLTEFQNRERIQQAKKLLCSRYSRVSEVALDVGFGSLSQFNRCFQRYTGESPTEYRSRVIPQAG